MSVANGPKSQGVTRKEVFTEQVKPKNAKIGMQMDTLNENVLTSQASLFGDEDDSFYTSNKRVVPISPVKTYTNSKDFKAHQQDIASSYHLYNSNEKQS